MSETLDLTEALILHQRESEWNFAACVQMDPEGVIDQFGWLAPDHILDLEVREYWSKFLTGADPTKAAMDCGIFYKLIERVTHYDLAFFQKPAFAAAIGEDIYLRQVAGQNKDLAKLIVERKIGEIKKSVHLMAESVPVGKHDYPDSADVHLEFLAGLDEDVRVIYTGIPSIDTALGGLERQTMTVLAARPSMGKSSLAMQIGEYNAEHGLRTVYFSIEMKRRQLWARRALGIAGIDSRQYKNKSLTEEQKEHLREISAGLVDKFGKNLIIIDDALQTVESIWKTAAEARPDLVIVDHMGLIHTDEQDDVKALGAISWAGKVIAKQFDCAFVYLYQLNRDVEKRGNSKRPVMSDLRGSGKIEENADVVALLYRQDYYEEPKPGQTVSDTEFIVAKYRDGTRYTCVHLEYNLKQQMFYARAANAQVMGEKNNGFKHYDND